MSVRTSPLPAAAAFVFACVFLGGCGLFTGGGSGALAVRSEAAEGALLRGRFSHAVYAFGDRDNLTILLSDGPMDRATQAITVRVFWAPRAAHTPVDPTATNASVEYVVFAPQAPAPGNTDNAQVGVYSGAGFVFLDDKPGAARFTARVRQADLRLADRSAAFADLLGKARLDGSFTAIRNDQAVLSELRTLQSRLSARLGYPRLVDATAK